METIRFEGVLTTKLERHRGDVQNIGTGTDTGGGNVVFFPLFWWNS